MIREKKIDYVYTNLFGPKDDPALYTTFIHTDDNKLYMIGDVDPTKKVDKFTEVKGFPYISRIEAIIYSKMYNHIKPEEAANILNELRKFIHNNFNGYELNNSFKMVHIKLFEHETYITLASYEKIIVLKCRTYCNGDTWVTHIKSINDTAIIRNLSQIQLHIDIQYNYNNSDAKKFGVLYALSQGKLYYCDVIGSEICSNGNFIEVPFSERLGDNKIDDFYVQTMSNIYYVSNGDVFLNTRGIISEVRGTDTTLSMYVANEAIFVNDMDGNCYAIGNNKYNRLGIGEDLGKYINDWRYVESTYYSTKTSTAIKTMHSNRLFTVFVNSDNELSVAGNDKRKIFSEKLDGNHDDTIGIYFGYINDDPKEEESSKEVVEEKPKEEEVNSEEEEILSFIDKIGLNGESLERDLNMMNDKIIAMEALLNKYEDEIYKNIPSLTTSMLDMGKNLSTQLIMMKLYRDSLSNRKQIFDMFGDSKEEEE